MVTPAVLAPVIVSNLLTSIRIISGLGLSFRPLALHTKAITQISRDEIEPLLQLGKHKVRLTPHKFRYTWDGDGKEYQVHARWYQHRVNPVQFSQPPSTHISPKLMLV